MPVRFATLDAGPDRSRALLVARALRAGGIRVEAVTDTAVVVRDEDRVRAERIVATLADPQP